jgi:TatA/E family protein of Tat protein translocase
MTVIFVVALVLFGPKKLPELGRMLGKAIGQLRRVQRELKATVDRELQTLEREAGHETKAAVDPLEASPYGERERLQVRTQ